MLEYIVIRGLEDEVSLTRQMTKILLGTRKGSETKRRTIWESVVIGEGNRTVFRHVRM